MAANFYTFVKYFMQKNWGNQEKVKLIKESNHRL